jgi:hypothetical protein
MAQRVTRWAELPAALRDAFRAYGGITGMSDADGPFNPTDAGAPHDARIRLRYALAARGYWFVCYETGGESHQYHVAIWLADPALWSRVTLYRSNPCADEIGPDLAADRFFDEP